LRRQDRYTTNANRRESIRIINYETSKNCFVRRAT
jgi:hypothetical protein